MGDDDQNIYAFRRTNVEFIRRFAEDFTYQRSEARNRILLTFTP